MERSMRKKQRDRTPPHPRGFALALAAALALVPAAIGACKNPYVSDILHGPAELNSLVIISQYRAPGETVYTDMPASRAVKPEFSAAVYEYSVIVPAATERLAVVQSLGKDAKIAAIEKKSPDGAADDPVQDTAYDYVFKFPAPSNTGGDPAEHKCDILIHVTRDYMESVTYTVHVFREQPAWITSLKVSITTVDTGDDPYASVRYYPNPYFESSVTGYSVGVAEAAKSVTLHLTKRAEEYEGIAVKVNGADAAASGIDVTYTTSFPADKQSITLTVAVTCPEENNAVVTYTVQIGKPFKVSLRTGSNMPAMTIRGTPETKVENGVTYYLYQPADVVSFTVKPLFGTELRGLSVTGVAAGGLYSSDIPLPSAGAPLRTEAVYNFIMPQGDAVISPSACVEVPTALTADGLNVRYVRSGGTGNGTSWILASGDLQAAIDNYDNTPGAANNYEIWAAEGTYGVPDFGVLTEKPWWAAEQGQTTHNITKPSGVSRESAGWPAIKNNYRHWAYILKDGVKIYGGFSGSEASRTDRDNRDWASHPTVLQAKTATINGAAGVKSAMRALIASNLTEPPLLDGITVVGASIELSEAVSAHLNVNGAAEANGGDSLVMANYGGAAYVVDSSPVFKNVTFKDGKGQGSGNLHVAGSSMPILINCVISGGIGVAGAGYGDAATVDVTSGGLVMIGGSVARNYEKSGVSLKLKAGNSVFVSAAFENNESSPLINDGINNGAAAACVNCSITGNWQKDDNLLKGLSLYNCVITDNYPLAAKVAVQSLTGGNNYYIKADFSNTGGLPDPISLADFDDKPDFATVPPDYFPLIKNGGSYEWRPNSGGYTNPFGTVTDANARAVIKSALEDAAAKLFVTDTTIRLGARQ
jgi:hypothetical protein